MHTTYIIQSLTNPQCPEELFLYYLQTQIKEGIKTYHLVRKIGYIITLTEATLLNVLQILIVKLKEYTVYVNNLNLIEQPTFQYQICNKCAGTMKIFSNKATIQKDKLVLSSQKHRIGFLENPYYKRVIPQKAGNSLYLRNIKS